MENISVKKNVSKSVEKNYLAQKMNVKLQNLAKREKLEENEIKNNLSKLLDTIEELENCKNCPGLNKCPNKIKGYVYYPSKDESKVAFNYIPCKYLKQHEENLKNKDSLLELTSARMKDIDPSDKKRADIIKWITKFYKNYNPSKENKGLYLHGSFGSGKTFLIAALFNELKANFNVSYEIVYFPELLRILKMILIYLKIK